MPNPPGRGRELCGLGLSSLDLAVAACVGTVSSCNVLPVHDTCTVVDCPPGCVALAGLCLWLAPMEPFAITGVVDDVAALRSRTNASAS